MQRHGPGLRALTALGLTILLQGCASSSGDDGLDLSEPRDGAMTAASDMAKADLPPLADMATTVGGGCNPANETIGANGGPDTCAYAQICDDATMKCVAAPVGTCTMASGAPVWNKTAKMAPVIVKATASLLATTNASTECLDGDPAALITVEFYAPQNLTSTDVVAEVSKQVKWKKSTMPADPWYSGTFFRALPPKNAKYGSFQVGINCGGAAGSAKSAGLYVVDGSMRTSNAVCVSW